MPDSFDYTTGTNSENVRLLQALIDEAPEYTEETSSRNANILKSIINNTEYTDAPQSEIEELLLRLKAKIGGEIEVDELNVTENGTYDAGVNKAYNPVKVELPLDSKTITENGTYTASDDNLAGFNEVTVAVEGYAKKSISPTPTAIATFNASALPMPSLSVGIEAVQDLHGYDNPWVGGAGKNKFDYSQLTNASGWTNTSGTYSGNIYNLYAYAGSGFPTQPTFKANTAYTLSMKVVDTDGTSRFVIEYTDSTNDYVVISSSNIGNYVTVTSNPSKTISKIYFTYNNSGNLSIREIMLEEGTSRTSWTPYSNICPFSGWSAVGVVVSPTTDSEDGTTYTTALKDGQGNPLTCYGGQLVNENGVQRLVLTHGYIASYNGETLPSTWISDRDVYAEGTTPTTGAEVVYELATPQQIPQDNLAIASQDGTNNLWCDSGDIQSGEYMEAL